MNEEQKQMESTIRLADESDTKKIIDFISKYREKDMTIKVSNNSFENILLGINYYSNLNIRYNLYDFSEEFILAEYNKDIQMLVSFGVPNDLSKAFNLNLILFNKLDINLLNNIIIFARNTFSKVSLISPTKFRANIQTDIDNYQDWLEILNNIGFCYETTRKHELDVDKSITSLVLNII